MEALKKDDELKEATLEVVKDNQEHEKEDEQAKFALFLSNLIKEVHERSNIQYKRMSNEIGANDQYFRKLAGSPAKLNSEKKVKTIIDAFLTPFFNRFLTQVESEKLIEYRQKINPIKDKEEYEEKIVAYMREYYDQTVVIELLILMSCRFGVREETLIARGNVYVECAKELERVGLILYSHGYYSLYFNDIVFLTRDMTKNVPEILYRKIKKPKANYNFYEHGAGYVSEEDYHEIYKLLHKVKATYKKAKETARETGKQEVPIAMVNMFASLGDDVK